MADEYIIRLRRGSLQDFTNDNPQLDLGECAVVFDGTKTYLKAGDGLKKFNDLPYVTNPNGGGAIDLTSYLKKDLSNLSTEDLDRVIRLTNAYKTIEAQFPQYYGIRATESETTIPFDFNSTTDNIIHVIYDLNQQSQRLQQDLPALSFMQGKIVIFEVKYGTAVTSGEVVLMPTGADKINGMNNPVEITKQGIGGILLATSTTFDWLPYDVTHDNKIIVTDGVEIVKANNIEFNGQGVTISQKGDSGVVVN
ncbi:hypothetical protein, partial [Clostridium sp.]|uniref:hypothetical protein n=1 Tax=Clostridium sp. TaxID=1506 RepID=UPI003F67A6BD